jgi:uncharacterized membrane protein YeaQ/YmgE (transglycosylase-associated protein family)
MGEIDLSTLDMTVAARWAHEVLAWIGFGTIVGLTAKAIMPGRDPGGSIVTLLLGIVGTVIGCGVLTLATKGQTVSPLSVVGFGVGTGGAFILLLFYRLLSGRLFPSGTVEHVRSPHYRSRSRKSANTTIINHD